MDRSHIVTQPLAEKLDDAHADHGGEPRPDALDINAALSNATHAEQPSADCPDATIDFEGATSYKGIDHYREDDSDDENVEEIVFGDDPVDEVSSETTMPAEAPARAVAEDVDDLADYMQNFLQRMKCSNAAEAEAVEEAEPEQEDTLDKPANSYAGPKAAPECKSDLEAMREVAIASANDSLSRHDQTVVKKTQAAFLIALCLWIAAAVVAYFATTVVGYTFIAAVVCGGTAAFFTSGYLLGLRKLRCSERPAQPVPSAPHTED